MATILRHSCSEAKCGSPKTSGTVTLVQPSLVSINSKPTCHGVGETVAIGVGVGVAVKLGVGVGVTLGVGVSLGVGVGVSDGVGVKLGVGVGV